MKNKTVIKLLGQEYTVVSEASEEHMQRVGFYVDGKFKEVSTRNGLLNTAMISVLSAINVAEDFLTVSDTNLELAKKNKIANEEIERLNKEIENLKQENLKLKGMNGYRKAGY